MENLSYACAFTGHRPAKLPFGYHELDERCLALKDRLSRQIERLVQSGVTVFYSGMALGVDMFAAEAVLALKVSYPHIRLIAVCPCATQADRWSDSMRARHRNICRRADEVVVLQKTYTPDCMHRRNRYMVDRAHHLIAVFDGIPVGGTAETVAYAKGLSRHVTVISP